MKSYYSCPDTAFVKYVPQPLQHLAIADFAKKSGGSIAFYTSEDFETLGTQGVIRSKIEERSSDIDGIIFFTLKQFGYTGSMNFEFMRQILGYGYEIGFVRENILISNEIVLDQLFPMLYATQVITERDESNEFWPSIWQALDKYTDKSKLHIA